MSFQTALFQTAKAQRLALVAALLLWCCLLVLVRDYYTDAASAAFLLWNLWLALVPLVVGASLDFKSRFWLLPFSIWILFLPNAPYILTDLIHLRATGAVPLWYDLALLLSCAGAGLFFGYLSLLDVHEKIQNRFGKRIGWIVALGSQFACGFGIYLGRFLRFNSWEVLTNPRGLFSKIAHLVLNHAAYPSALGVTLIFGIGLCLGYLALRAASSSTVRAPI